MKTKLALVALLSALSARGITLTASFDGLTTSTHVPSGYTEGGLTFTTDGSFGTAHGTFGGVLWNLGTSYPDGHALFVDNHDWIGISAGGDAISSLSVSLGSNWNFYLIELGLMDTRIEWQMLLDGVMVGSGFDQSTRERRTHGVGILNVTEDFDTFRMRTTATIYEALPPTGPIWFYDRGTVVGAGDRNLMAFDKVRVTLAEVDTPPSTENVPDGGPTLLICAMSGVLLWNVRRMLSLVPNTTNHKPAARKRV